MTLVIFSYVYLLFTALSNVKKSSLGTSGFGSVFQWDMKASHRMETPSNEQRGKGDMINSEEV